jgi:tetratricopeptide (TPR) repeat protein
MSKAYITNDCSLIQNALDDVTAARTFGRDDKGIDRRELSIRMRAAYLLRSNGHTEEAQEHYGKAATLLGKCKLRGGRLYGLEIRFHCYPMTEASDAMVFQLAKSRIQNGDVGGASVYAYSSIWQGNSEAREAMKKFKEIGIENFDNVHRIGIGFLAVHLGEKELASDCYDLLNKSDVSRILRLHSQWISLLLGDHDSVDEYCRELAEQSDDFSSIDRMHWEILTGKADRKHVLESAGNSRGSLTFYLTGLAIARLAAGEKEEAQELLQEVVELGLDTAAWYRARSILYGLKQNPNWPHEASQ